MMKVYWRIERVERLNVLISFWKKEDKSDAIEVTVEKADTNEVIRQTITEITGNTNFELEYWDK